MDKVILYTTHCPKCIALEKILKKNNIDFEINDDMDTIIEVAEKANISTAPILSVNDEILTYEKAMKRYYIF